jgi:hypothetical protein
LTRALALPPQNEGAPVDDPQPPAGVAAVAAAPAAGMAVGRAATQAAVSASKARQNKLAVLRRITRM